MPVNFLWMFPLAARFLQFIFKWRVLYYKSQRIAGRVNMNIVWYRRDLRVNDHLPLSMAAKSGEVLPLYIIEPSFWQGGDLSARHYTFVLDSLDELSRRLAGLGGCLYVTIGEANDVFRKLEQAYGTVRVFFYKSEELAGSSVSNWLENNGVPFEASACFAHEANKIPVKSTWLKAIEAEGEIATSKLMAPGQPPLWLSNSLEKFRSFPVEGEVIPSGQPGGEKNAEEALQSFLHGRYKMYGRNGDSLLKVSNYSSRLSPYLAWGNISLKTVVKKTLGEIKEAKAEEDLLALTSFLDKLYSRYLANEFGPSEKQGLPFSEGRMWTRDERDRIQTGRTGIPIIDAALLSLRKTGWLPYSLRAILATFLCLGLGLDKELVKKFLGRQFQDYDPAILENEMDLCASFSLKGSSAYFHPVRAGKKLDRDGTFIKRYVHGLTSLPIKYVHEPWLYPGFYDLGYPVPLKNPDKLYKDIKLAAERNKPKKAPNKKAGKGEQLAMDLFGE